MIGTENSSIVQSIQSKKMIRLQTVNGIKLDNKKSNECEDCARGKICRANHPTRMAIKASKDAAILHIDTCGPVSIPSLGGNKYFVLATQEFSNFKLIEFVQTKSEVENSVKQIISRVEIESKGPVKMIITGNGSEYLNHNLNVWLLEK